MNDEEIEMRIDEIYKSGERIEALLDEQASIIQKLKDYNLFWDIKVLIIKYDWIGKISKIIDVHRSLIEVRIDLDINDYGKVMTPIGEGNIIINKGVGMFHFDDNNGNEINTKLPPHL